MKVSWLEEKPRSGAQNCSRGREASVSRSPKRDKPQSGDREFPLKFLARKRGLNYVAATRLAVFIGTADRGLTASATILNAAARLKAAATIILFHTIIPAQAR